MNKSKSKKSLTIPNIVQEIMDHKREGMMMLFTPFGITSAGYWKNLRADKRMAMLRGMIIEVLSRFQFSLVEIKKVISIIEAEIEESGKKKASGELL